MIIVVGSPVVAPGTLRPEHRAAGLAVAVALAAQAAGARVELVGKVGDDPEGDALAVELERIGVGHAALLRDPSSATPAAGKQASRGLTLSRADVELALRYLTDATVIVAIWQTEPSTARVIEESAAFSGAQLIVVDGADPITIGAPRDEAKTITRLVAPPDDDGAFAALVGGYAAALDRGDRPAAAFQAAVERVGWEPANG